MPRKKKQRGRPSTKPMPERTDATPEQIAEAFLRLPADYEWQYTKGEPSGYLKEDANDKETAKDD